MKPRIELCLLVWNEMEGCKKDIPMLPNVYDRVFAIDAGSTDGTVEFLESQGIEVFFQQQRTYNGAYLDAFSKFSGDCLVFFHPKGTINVESLETMKNCMSLNYDFVLGSRMLKLAQNEEDMQLFRFRKWFVMAIGLLAKLRWGMGKNGYLDDPLHGYRGLSRKFIETLSLKPFGVTADLEMIKHAYRNSVDFTSIPVNEVPRISGKTHFPALKTGRQILAYLFKIG